VLDVRTKSQDSESPDEDVTRLVENRTKRTASGNVCDFTETIEVFQVLGRVDLLDAVFLGDLTVLLQDE